MADWKFINLIANYLGKGDPKGKKAPSEREQEAARELRRSGWALASFRRQTAKQQKVTRARLDTDKQPGLPGPPPQKK